ncbi:hypothetical protein PO124_10700 [Bacillus licheniformis]|nr:hypothetical protein [Bacillus licheniformis]
MLKLDDPVGAIAVHGICGVWGTLAVGLSIHRAVSLRRRSRTAWHSSRRHLSIAAWTLAATSAVAAAMKALAPIRVSKRRKFPD